MFLQYHGGSARPYLIFSNKKDIRLVEVSPGRSAPKTTVVVKQLDNAAALDFFLQKNKVCWTELSQSPVIQCSEIDPRLKGKVEKMYIVDSGLKNPEGLACDWINNKIYWTDSVTKRIEVTSLEPDPPARRVLFWEDIDLPRAIVVAPNDGVLFWSDWGAYPKIERAAMNGDAASRRVIVDKDIAWPNGLTVDYDNKMLYWLEAKFRYIASVDWDGNNMKIIFQEREALPQAFAISVYFSELYWTDWTTNSLNMFNFSSPSTAFIDYQDGTSYHLPERMKFRSKLTPMDIKVFEPMRQKAGKSGCLINNGGCSHLCLAAPGGYSCSCPTGIKLINNRTCADGYGQMLLLAKRDELIQISLDTPDYTETFIPFDMDLETMDDEFSTVAVDFDPVDGLVYWSDQIHGIFRSQLNGSQAQNIISDDINQPDGLAVDYIGRNLFWIDTGNDRIEVCKLNGSSRRILISQDMDEPRDIVLDPVRGWIFWSDWGERAKIERAWMDGTHRNVIIEKDIGWPNGIAIDVDAQRIYFCDAKLDRIEMINVDGSDRRVLIEESLRHPFGLSLLGDYIYWTDWEHNTVERAHKLTGKDNRLIMVNQKDLMSVETVNTKPNPKWTNACAKKNGGCSHLCLFTPGGRVCACPNGYEISGGVKCVVPEAFLLYTRKSDIGRVSITSPNSNGYILPIKGISESSALDFDPRDSRVYWTDNEEKTISRAFLNGTHRETLITSGLDFPDGLSLDWISGNIYWTDTGLNRIEVARSDGSARRALIWKNLNNPASIVVHPAAGVMFWSTWSEVSVIERAALDGSGRSVFIADVGKTNGLTLDFASQRLYWTDIDKQAISFAQLSSAEDGARLVSTKTIYTATSAQLYGLSLYKNHVYWTDLKGHTIERVDKETGANPYVIMNNIDDVVDILIYQAKMPDNVGTNPCAIDNGGCPFLCLFVNGSVNCTCPSHTFPATRGDDVTECREPEQFLLFSQKNKLSRLLVDDQHPDEVPDLVLPIEGARDIQSIGYDVTERIIYWIDYGSKKKSKHQISIKRAYENGTAIDKIFHGSHFRPYDLSIDPFARLIYWSCDQTNAINVTRMDLLEPDETVVGSILGGNDDRPRSISVHPQKSLIFWVNMASPVRIERSKVDGHSRRTIVNGSLGEPSDLTVDTMDNLIFWSDLGLKRIEMCDLDGGKRRILIDNEIQGPVLIAIQGNYLYWADRSQQSIIRVNKQTGRDREVVKAHAPHLSALLSVPMTSSIVGNNPCLRADCSHLCLVVDAKKGHAQCSCPLGSGLVLNADDRTCGLPPTCKPAEFTCTSGSPACIPLQWRCDGQAECIDHSDEIGCPECGPKQFKCRNNGCVNGTLVCDGVKHCEDSSDELNCCPKEKFQCTLSGECIDSNKTCNGVNDCSDSSDELLPQCASVNQDNGLGGLASAAGGSGEAAGSGSSTAIAISLVIGFFVAVVGGFGVYMYKRGKNTSDNDSNNPLSQCMDNGAGGISGGTLQRGAAAGSEGNNNHVSSVPVGPNGAVGGNSNEHDEFDTLGMMSTLSGPVGVGTGGLGGSSNGISYDRSHVTGASSSTTSSYNSPIDFSNPPPSPATVVRSQYHLPHRQQHQHQSLHSLPRSRTRGGGSRMAHRNYTARSSHHLHNPPPPPTPYSTDANEESDYGHAISGPHFNSAANSIVQGGYESSDAYGEHMGYGNSGVGHQAPPPSTPLYYSDYNQDEEEQGVIHVNSCPPSPTPEETFFLMQPPPSPVPFHDDDDDDSKQY